MFGKRCKFFISSKHQQHLNVLYSQHRQSSLIVRNYMNNLVVSLRDHDSIKDILWNKNVSIEEKMNHYNTFKTRCDHHQDLLEMIEVCLLTTNSCSVMKREKEFKECLFDLKSFCLQLSEDGMETKLNERSWNFIIQHFCKEELFHSYAIYVFESVMNEKRLARPNLFTLTAVLKACPTGHASIEFCEQIVSQLEQFAPMNAFLYGDVVSTCVFNNDLERALQVILEMKRKDIQPNFSTCTLLFKEAKQRRNLEVGMKLYQFVKDCNLESARLSFTIVSFLLRMRKPELAIEEIEIMKERQWMTFVSWKCLIQAHAQMNDIRKAIDVIYEMKDNGMNPDSFTFNTLKSACVKLNLAEEGQLIEKLSESESCINIDLPNDPLQTSDEDTLDSFQSIN